MVTVTESHDDIDLTSWHPSLLVDRRRLLELSPQAPEELPWIDQARLRIFRLACRERFRCNVPRERDISRLKGLALNLGMTGDQAWREIRITRKEMEDTPRVKGTRVNPRALLRRACVILRTEDPGGAVCARGRRLLDVFAEALGLQRVEVERLLARFGAPSHAPPPRPAGKARSRPCDGPVPARTRYARATGSGVPGAALAPGLSAGCGFAVAGLLTGHPVALASAVGTGLLLVALTFLSRAPGPAR